MKTRLGIKLNNTAVALGNYGSEGISESGETLLRYLFKKTSFLRKIKMDSLRKPRLQDS